MVSGERPLRTARTQVLARGGDPTYAAPTMRVKFRHPRSQDRCAPTLPPHPGRQGQVPPRGTKFFRDAPAIPTHPTPHPSPAATGGDATPTRRSRIARRPRIRSSPPTTPTSRTTPTASGGTTTSTSGTGDTAPGATAATFGTRRRSPSGRCTTRATRSCACSTCTSSGTSRATTSARRGTPGAGYTSPSSARRCATRSSNRRRSRWRTRRISTTTASRARSSSSPLDWRVWIWGSGTERRGSKGKGGDGEKLGGEELGGEGGEDVRRRKVDDGKIDGFRGHRHQGEDDVGDRAVHEVVISRERRGEGCGVSVRVVVGLPKHAF